MTALGMMNMHAVRTVWPYISGLLIDNDYFTKDQVAVMNSWQINVSGVTFLTLSWLSDKYNPKYVTLSA